MGVFMRTREQMAEYQRERRAKFTSLKGCMDVRENVPKRDVAPTVNLDVASDVAKFRDMVKATEVVDLQARVSELEGMVKEFRDRIERLEWHVSPAGVSKKEALRPGGHPNELYGA
jgi:uncharacterized protein YceH (UPF0502 family)